MKIKTYNSLSVGGTSLDVPLLVPETVEEFDQNAKRSGACLDEAINNVVYRGSLAAWRDGFLHGIDATADGPAILGVDKRSGIARHTKTVELSTKSEDGSPRTTEVWDETEASFFKRVCAEIAKRDGVALDAAAKSFQDLAREVAARIEFDASERERKPAAPKTPGKEYLRAAEMAISAGKGALLAQRLADKLGRAVDATADALAFAMKEDEDNEKRARREAMLANL